MKSIEITIKKKKQNQYNYGFENNLYFEQKMWPESKLFRCIQKKKERQTDSGYMNSKQKKKKKYNYNYKSKTHKNQEIPMQMAEEVKNNNNGYNNVL